MIKLFVFIGIAGVSLATYLATYGQGPDYQMSPSTSLYTKFQKEGLMPDPNAIVENDEVEHGIFEVPEEDERQLKMAMSNMDGMNMGGMKMDDEGAMKMPMADDGKSTMKMGEEAAENMPMADEAKTAMKMGDEGAMKMPMAGEAKTAMKMGEEAAGKMPMADEAKTAMKMEGDGTMKMPMADDGKTAMKMGEEAAENMPMAGEAKTAMKMGEDAAENMPMADEAKTTMKMEGDGTMKMPMADEAKTAMKMDGDGEAPHGEEEKVEGGLKITEEGKFDREVTLTMAEWKFSDLNLNVKKGEKIRFTITNEGKIPHEFMFMSMAAMQAVNYRAKRADWNLLEHEALFEKSLVLPGGKFSFVAEIQQDGAWMFMCMLPYHMQMGMMGQIATPGMAMDMGNMQM